VWRDDQAAQLHLHHSRRSVVNDVRPGILNDHVDDRGHHYHLALDDPLPRCLDHPQSARHR
jgi:hypothetical protein